MTLLLAGDIGGTKSLLRLVEMPTATDTTSGAFQIDTLYEGIYSSQEYPDLVPIVGQFLKEASQKLGEVPSPKGACFAIAGPVVGHKSVLTNLSWTLTTDRLEKELNIPHVKLINDFVAVGYGVLGMNQADLHTLQPGEPQTAAPIAVIGAGTGLGQGFLIRHLDEYFVYPSEGGHADFAPRTEIEFELLQDLQQREKIDRVSVERVVSGMGIASIYQFLRDRAIAAGKDISPADKDPSEISQGALKKSDPICEQTLQIFVEAYGAEAGNLALKLLPYGGLYLAGGIAAKILPLITEGDRFINSFNHKGRVSPLAEKVPVHIVLNPQVGLIGAAICAARL
ncbi:glucokinase [Oscillatoria sp. HE19RPO]|uniref:glucokinase n=1 Tax=Oscillatoria sp. HE19RPO TaxID=2954806 RepID=UPI0020C45EEA|nr:glucokinase [Oscillatoria sp. HE19RPO]